MLARSDSTDEEKSEAAARLGKRGWKNLTPEERAEIARKGGLLGGAGRAEALDPERRSELAREAVAERWKDPEQRQAFGEQVSQSWNQLTRPEKKAKLAKMHAARKRSWKARSPAERAAQIEKMHAARAAAWAALSPAEREAHLKRMQAGRAQKAQPAARRKHVKD